MIQRLLGAGGMGEVYEAEDLALHRARIALKTICAEYASRDDVRQRFQDEVLLARSIAHPNICPVYEMFSSVFFGGEIWFLTMKLPEGETLGARLAAKRLQPDEAMRIAVEVSSGLDAIHAFGIVHRDLKPGNIFLERYPAGERAIVTDFGLARMCSEEPSLTDAGHVVGTRSYLAPEVRTGGQATPRSDVYSFGVVLHEMFVGYQPGSASTMIAETAHTTPNEHRLRAVISRCLAATPEWRFASAGAAVVALQAVPAPLLTTRRKLLAASASAMVIGGAMWSEREELDRWLHPIPRPRRVAVLPAIGGRTLTEDAALLNGVMESVSGRLERVEGRERDLFVVPTRELRRRNVIEMSQVMGLFGANLVLIFSLQNLGQTIALTFRLLESSTGRLIRSSKLSTAAATLYNLANLAADRAALLLDVRPKDLPEQSPTGDTVNADAYAAYERGRGLLRGYGLPNVDRAIAELQKAIELNPGFARAWATLGDAYSSRYRLTKDVAALEIAERNTNKALALAPDLSAGFSSRAKCLQQVLTMCFLVAQSMTTPSLFMTWDYENRTAPSPRRLAPLRD